MVQNQESKLFSDGGREEMFSRERNSEPGPGLACLRSGLRGVGFVPKKKTVMEFPTTQPEPMVEQAIRQRPYELYIERSMNPGHALDDWLQAEGELVLGHSTSDSN
jgi:hypothetical protein